jgi:hypothetical protein
MIGADINYSPSLFPGDAFYDAQQGPAPYCTSADMNDLRNQVRQHEGEIAGWPTPNHIQYFGTYLEQVDVRAEFEKTVVFAATQQAANELFAARIAERITGPMADAGLQQVDVNGHPFEVNCTFIRT